MRATPRSVVLVLVHVLVLGLGLVPGLRLGLAAADTEIEMPPDHVTPRSSPKTAQVVDDDPPVQDPGDVDPTRARISDRPGADISVTTPAPPAQVRAKWVEPYGAIVGGVELQSLHQAPGQTTGTQNPTVAISRLGLRGGVGAHVTFASEFEASLGGPLGYGSSVWEGQAAIAIWDQFVRYERDGFTFAAGRIDDPASFDFVSAHSADLLLSDQYTRDPLLYSGADRGNGLWFSYALDRMKHVTLGLTLHSTNPTGITGTLIIGGKLQPFDRPFYLAAAAVGNSQNNLPDQNLHIYFASPSMTAHFEHLDAKAEVQLYSLDTQEATMDDQTIRGYNLRAGARAWTATTIGKASLFLNVSKNENEILDPTSSKYRLPDLFHSYTVSTGADLDYSHKNGVGFGYAMVDTREPGQHTRQHYLNLGTTYWIEDSLAIGVRAAVFAQQLSGQPMTTGSRSLFVTARLVLD
ncbi:MAG: hypothetical protein ABI467_12650 [Kofleriaceae bacterium]